MYALFLGKKTITGGKIMTGIHHRIYQDKVTNPYSPKAILERNGQFFSVNHYPAGLTHDLDEHGNRIYKEERFEIRYEVTSNEPV